MTRYKPTRMLWPILTLAVLVGLATEVRSRPKPQDAAPYHTFVKSVVEAIPVRIGDWLGSERPVPRQAQQLLSPNALLSRSYRNLRTGEQVGVLLVQCRDARDMVGHYPRYCYPNSGWNLLSAERQDLSAGDLLIPATRYEFAMERTGDTFHLSIYNFMILPNGAIVPDIQGVNAAEADYTQRFFGAAQVQFVFQDPTMEEQTLRNISVEFLKILRDAVIAIQSGVKP
ncbi:MAG: EpsI family protein [Phycisphaeraceae bacterium]|nr:EpsI family protein [Phycisphaeraceae bacterium]